MSIDVRQLRRLLNVSQAQLADMLGVAPNTVARWERGELGMSRTSVRLLELFRSKDSIVAAARRAAARTKGKG